MALHPDPANWPAALVSALEQGLGLPFSGAAQGVAAQELREVLQLFDGDMWRDLRQESGGKLTLAAQARLKAWLANEEKPLPVFASAPPHPQPTEGKPVTTAAVEKQQALVHREEALKVIPTPSMASDASGMVGLPALATAHAAAEQAVAKQGSAQNFVWRVSPSGKLARAIVPASRLLVMATKPGKRLAEVLCFGDFGSGSSLQQLQGKRLAEHGCTVAVSALHRGAGCLLSIQPAEQAALKLEDNHLASAMAQGRPRIFGQALLVCRRPAAPGKVHFEPMPKEACQDAVDAGSKRSTAGKTGLAFGAFKSAGKRKGAAEPKGKKEPSAEGVRLDERKDQIKAILQGGAQAPALPGNARLPANAPVNAAPADAAPLQEADDAAELGKRGRAASPQAAREAAASEEEDDWGPRWSAAVEKPVKRRREEVSQSALDSAALEAREAASPCSDGAAAEAEDEAEGLEQLLAPFKGEAEPACDASASPCMSQAGGSLRPAGADEQRKAHLQQLLARARRVAHG